MTKGNGGANDEFLESPAEEPGEGAPSETPEAGLSEIEALRRERDDLRDQLLRKRADFENYRRRMERDRAQAGAEATSSLVQALIPVLDNLERALTSKASDTSIRQGVELIQRDLRSVLEAQGVTWEDASGKPFDPAVHEAVSHDAAPGYDDGVIIEALGKAYFLKGRLIRPAPVRVSKGHRPAETPGEPEQEPVH